VEREQYFQAVGVRHHDFRDDHVEWFAQVHRNGLPAIADVLNLVAGKL
jgi:hypothetical protein